MTFQIPIVIFLTTFRQFAVIFPTSFAGLVPRVRACLRKVLVFPVNQADYDLYHRVHLVRMALGNHKCQGHEGGVGDAL